VYNTDYNETETLKSLMSSNFNNAYAHLDLDTINENTEENKMSIIHAAVLKDGVVMASDSRSSKNTNGKWDFDDSYDKLYYFSDINLGVISAGLNEFGDNNFTYLCKQAEMLYKNSLLDPGKCIDLVIDQLNNALMYYNQFTGADCQIVYGLIANQSVFNTIRKTPKLIAYTFSRKNGVNSIKTIKRGESVTYGVPWMQNYFVGRSVNKDMSANEYGIEIQKLLKDLIIFSNKYDDPSFVGGNVKSLVIT